MPIERLIYLTISDSLTLVITFCVSITVM